MSFRARQTSLPSGPLGAPDFQHAEIRRHSIQGGAVMMLAQGAKFFLQLGATVILARLLTPEDYGLFSIAFSIALFVSFFKDLGLSIATVQRAEISQLELSAMFWVNVLWGCVLALATVIAAPGIAAFFHEPRLTEILWVMATLSILAGISNQHWALVTRRMHFARSAIVDLISLGSGIGVGLATAWIGWGYWSLVATQVVIATLRAGGGLVAANWRPSFPRAVSVRPFLTLGGEITAVSVLGYATRNLDNMLIGWQRGARELGFYDKAYQLLLLPILQINLPIGTLAIGVLSRLAGNAPLYRDYCYRIALICASLGMPLITFLFVAAEPIVLLALGDAWRDTIPLFRALAPAAFIDTFASMIAWMFISLGKTARQLRSSVVITVLIVASMWIGVQWGALGVALAYSISRALVFLPQLIYACYDSPVQWMGFLKTLTRPTVASLGAAVLLVLVSRWIFLPSHPFPAVFWASAAYGIFYLALWVLLPGGINVLTEIWGRFPNL